MQTEPTETPESLNEPQAVEVPQPAEVPEPAETPGGPAAAADTPSVAVEPAPAQAAAEVDANAPPADPLEGVEVRVDPESVDEDGFVSLWNVAAATMGGKIELTRMLASKLLGFLCKQKCDFVFISSTDAKYLDDWFERDPALLYNWMPESEMVDVMTQHAQVPASALLRLLKEKKFNPVAKQAPRRADRVDWFTNQWCIG